MPKIDRKEIERKVKEILVKELGVKIENITSEKRLIEDLGMDSFTAIELMFELEDGMGIEIPEKETLKLVIVKDVIDYIISRLSEKESG